MSNTDGKYRYPHTTEEDYCPACGGLLACGCDYQIMMAALSEKPVEGLPQNKYYNIVEGTDDE